MCSTHSMLLYCTQREGRNKQRVSDLQESLQGMLLEAGLQSIWQVEHEACQLPATSCWLLQRCLRRLLSLTNAIQSTEDTTGRAETHEGVVLATIHSPSSTPLCSEHADLLSPRPRGCCFAHPWSGDPLQLVHLGCLHKRVVFCQLLSPCSLVVEVAVVCFCIPTQWR